MILSIRIYFRASMDGRYFVQVSRHKRYSRYGVHIKGEKVWRQKKYRESQRRKRDLSLTTEVWMVRGCRSGAYLYRARLTHELCQKAKKRVDAASLLWRRSRPALLQATRYLESFEHVQVTSIRCYEQKLPKVDAKALKIYCILMIQRVAILGQTISSYNFDLPSLAMMKRSYV